MAATFWRCLDISKADDDADDPGALVVVGCLCAMSTILESVSRLPHLFVQIEPTLLPILQRMLTTDGQAILLRSSSWPTHMLTERCKDHTQGPSTHQPCHVCATIESFQADPETLCGLLLPIVSSLSPMLRIKKNLMTMRLVTRMNSRARRSCILMPIPSLSKRVALVTYLENNRAGITIFKFVLHRGYLHMVFMIQLSLVLWLLGKTISLNKGSVEKDCSESSRATKLSVAPFTEKKTKENIGRFTIRCFMLVNSRFWILHVVYNFLAL